LSKERKRISILRWAKLVVDFLAEPTSDAVPLSEAF
jgi:hypothetical protein